MATFDDMPDDYWPPELALYAKDGPFELGVVLRRDQVEILKSNKEVWETITNFRRCFWFNKETEIPPIDKLN